MPPLDPSDFEFSLGYGNIMGTPKMSRAKVHEDLADFKAEGISAGGFVEMKWPSYWKALRSVFPKKSWGTYPKRFAPFRGQVIFWNYNEWVNTENITRHLHGPSKFSAQRKIRAVRLQHIKTQEINWIILTHFLPRQWNPKYRPVRRGMWLKAEKRLKDLIEQTEGETVYLFMDQNRKDYKMFPGWFYYGPVGVDITATSDEHQHFYSELLALNTDHPGRVIRKAKAKRQWSQ